MLVVGPIAEVDLPSQKVIRHGGDSGPRYFEFEVDAFRKHCLLNGLDDIGLTMANMESIRAFEQVRSAHFPWLDGATTRVPKLFAVNKRRGRTSGGRAERGAWHRGCTAVYFRRYMYGRRATIEVAAFCCLSSCNVEHTVSTHQIEGRHFIFLFFYFFSALDSM